MNTSETKPTSTFRSQLKTLSVVGGASVLNILIGMVKTKFVAILLGPSGVGLVSVYGQIIAVVTTVTGFGISTSGVRQVAEATGTNNSEQITRTIITLRRASWLTGGFGALVMVIFCSPISHFTFANSEYAMPIAIIGITLLLSSVSTGQISIIRGTRRITDYAKINVIGALFGALISIPCLYFWGKDGIVVSLVASSASALITSWWYSRKVPLVPITVSWSESRKEARTLLILGTTFMGAALVSTATTYAIQAFLINRFSMADAGIYQAAYILSGVLVGFVLNAMGSDYYPRLTAVSNDNPSIYAMINQQSLISILLALPCLALMMVFSPMVINLFYTESFSSAVPVLRWCILGIFGRVVTWPLGFVLLAKGKGKLFFLTESIGCIIHLSAVFLFTHLWGLKGAGIAFLFLYTFHLFLMLIVVHRLVGATWSYNTLKITLTGSAVMVLLMLNCTFNNNMIVLWTINICSLVLTSFFCFRQLSEKSGIDLRMLLDKFGVKKA